MSTQNGSPRGRWRRIAAAALVAAGMTAPLLGFSPARAQEGGPLSLASITPADAALYAEISLDPESEQLQGLDDILLRLGGEESIIDSLSDVNLAGTGSVDFSGAELAVVVLPSALEAQDTDIVSDSLSGDTDAIAEDISSATEETQGIALLLKPTDLEDAVSAAEDSLVEIAGSEAAVESETIGDVEIRSAGADTAEATAYAVVDDILVFGSGVDEVASFVGAAESGSLADSETFVTANELLPAERAAFAFVNGQAFIDAIEAADDPSAALAQDLVEDLGKLNVDQGIAVVADEPGLRFETVQVPRDGSTVEASGSATDLVTADRVPAETLLFVNGFNLGQTALLEGTALLLVSALAGTTTDSDALPIDATPIPDASPVVDDVDAIYDAAAQTIGVNLKTEFLDTLTGEYAFALWGVDVADPTQIGAILASDVGDVDALDGTLSFITLFVQAGAEGQASVTSRTVGDASINNVVFGDAAAPVSVDYGIVDDELLIGVGDGVDVYIDGPDASLADDAAYQETLGYLPSEIDGVFYVDLAAVAGLSTDLESATAGFSMDDASEACGDYGSQADAQEAYEADPSENFELDLDFDGDACEDFFTASDATPMAQVVAEVPVETFATVSFVEDGYAFTSSIIVLSDES